MKFSKICFYPKIFLLWKGEVLSSTHTPSVQHVGSIQGPHLFSTRNLSVPHQKLLSSTPKLPHFNTPFSSTPKLPQFQTQNPSELKGLLNWAVCGTEGFLVWNWGIFGVEPRGFWWGTEGFWLKKSGPFVWNECVEMRGCGTAKDPLKSRRKLNPNTYLFDISNYYNVCKTVYSDIWKKSLA